MIGIRIWWDIKCTKIDPYNNKNVHYDQNIIIFIWWLNGKYER